MDELQRGTLQALIEPILVEEAMEQVELTCRPQGRQLYLRLLVDRVGGVTIQQCARVNRLIGEALETANLIAESYTLELSSPGLDRPLVSKRDFERAVGESVRVELKLSDPPTNFGGEDSAEGEVATPLAERRKGKPEGLPSEVTGMVLAVQPEAVVVKTGSGNLTVPFAHIRHAVKVVRW